MFEYCDEGKYKSLFGYDGIGVQMGSKKIYRKISWMKATKFVCPSSHADNHVPSTPHL